MTHPELVETVKQLLAVKKLSPADAKTAQQLVESRTFTRAQKETISALAAKYRYKGQQDAYTLNLP